jgi:hypothetical protein
VLTLPRAARITFWLLLGWSVVVLQQWLAIIKLDLGSTSTNFNIFYYLFAQYELIAWLALMLGLVLSLMACRSTSARALTFGPARTRATAALLLGVLGLLWCGTLFIHHGYPFSMDEFGALFQAEIFRHGQLESVIPTAWRQYAAALTPVFVTHDRGASTWISGYLPVYAALRTLFLQLGLTDLLNPMLAVISVLLIADCARRLWPDQPDLPLVAATLLLSSTQFLATSISYYSMPAHLCASLLWLSLYLRDTPRSLALLPWLGGLALGLHQPTVHPLFVAPFCLDIVRRRRFGLALYCAFVYCGFLWLWFAWHNFTAFNEDVVARDLTWFRWPDLKGVFVQSMNITLLCSWQSAALVLCFVCAIGAIRQYSAMLICMLSGVLLSFLLYCFFFLDQGHGWGYRYVYSALGNIVLLATFGWSQLAQQLGRAAALRMLAVSSCFAVLVQTPLRAFEIEREIRPFARARDFLQALPEKVVLIDHRLIWYGQDLIRNDPHLVERPLIVDMHRLSVDDLHKLKRLGDTRVVGPMDLAALQMLASPELERIARETLKQAH